jgi:hypothetical protein
MGRVGSSGHFLVTRPHPGSGIGANFASLAGAVWAARRLDRTVIVDWRGSAFLTDKSLNYFTEFFETPAQIQGVEIRYAPCAELPGDVGSPDVEEITAEQLREAVAGRVQPPRWTVVRNYHPVDRLDAGGDPARHFWTMRDFYRDVRPLPFIVREIDEFAAAQFGDAFVIGVNVSTGNGEFAKGTAYAGRVDLGVFADEKTFFAKMARARERAVRGLPRELRHRSKFFFATDSYAMHDLLMKLPDVVTRRKMFPPPGVGRVFCDYTDPAYTDHDAIVDAIVDMLLLARCNALVRNGSAFNAYATTVTAYFGGNVQHIEKLYTSYWLKAVRREIARRLRR